MVLRDKLKAVKFNDYWASNRLLELVIFEIKVEFKSVKFNEPYNSGSMLRAVVFKFREEFETVWSYKSDMNFYLYI